MPKGISTLCAEADIEDFARRMAEHGATEEEIESSALWTSYVRKYLSEEKRMTLTFETGALSERGRALLSSHYQQAGVSMVRGAVAFRFSDVPTGRFLKAEDAYSRLKFVGARTPAVWKYPAGKM